MKYYCSLLALCLSLSIFAQKGDFLLTHHHPEQSNIDYDNFEIISNNNGLLCIANRSGVLTYDGDLWDYFQTPSSALSIDVDDQDIMYVGSIGTFGKIDFTQNSFEYQSLLETDTIEDLFLQTEHFKDHVYFLGSSYLGIYSVEQDDVTLLNDDYLNMFRISDRLFVNTVDTTFELFKDSLKIVDTEIKIASVHNFEDRLPLIVDFDGKLHVWDKRPKSITHNDVIEEGGYEVEEAKWINDSLIACTTFANGIVFLNYNDLKYKEVIDYHSGLPDNDIYAMHTDGFGGVWVAHPFGLTSVSPLFPAFSYSNYPGLKGNLTGFFQKGEDLWVTTSQGLFHFDQDTVFKNKVYYTKIQTRRSTPPPTPQPVQPDPKKDKKKSRRGLFKKKKRAEDDSKEKKGLFKAFAKDVSEVFDNPNNVEKVSRKQAKNTRYKRNVRKVPVRVNIHFSKVDGTDGKYFDLLEYGDELLLVGNTGIYEVGREGADLIIPESIRSAMVISTGQLIISTDHFELKSFERVNDIWIEQVSKDLDDIIVNMTEDSSGKVWLAGSTHLFNLQASDSTLLFSKSYALKNQFLDEVEILERNDTTYFINSQGYFFYNEQLDEISESESYKSTIGVANAAISDPGNGVWINNGKNWFLLPKSGSPTEFEYMNLFKDLISITKDLDSDEYWLVTRDNQLLKYNPSKNKELSPTQLFIKRLSSQKGAINMRKRFTLSYDENFLTVELSKPDFLGLLNPEFQYKLEGLHTDWSEWTKSKSIDFSYLPAGQYSLSVRSRDAFDRIEEAKMLDFTVRSPYWQRPWFYALQIIFFGALVVVSSRMNQSKSQNRLLSGGLSVLTLILIIEFIQSAAGALLNIQSTPVVDFLIDVFVALLIFPLEKFLREFLSNGKVEVKKIEKSSVKGKKGKKLAKS